MGRRSHTQHLDLWMNGRHVGVWSRHAARDTLSYSAAWADAADGRPLSLSLPFQPGNLPHQGAAVRHYFSNLLPDSQVILERLAQRFKTGTTDAFDLLAEIGRDCVGALQIVPAGEYPGDPALSRAKRSTTPESPASWLLRSLRGEAWASPTPVASSGSRLPVRRKKPLCCVSATNGCAPGARPPPRIS